MIIVNSKIVQATRKELYEYYLSEDWYEVYSFPDFLAKMEDAGCEVVSEDKPKVYAVDFDGYLCQNAWPDIGEPNIALIRHFRELREQGHKLILWTCREGKLLQNAIDWCADFGLGFDAHNQNLPEQIAEYGGDCRKISADWYCDDKNYGGT